MAIWNHSLLSGSRSRLESPGLNQFYVQRTSTDRPGETMLDLASSSWFVYARPNPVFGEFRG